MSGVGHVAMETVERVHRLEQELQHERNEASERRAKMAKMADLMQRMEAELGKLGSGEATTALHHQNNELRAALAESERLRLDAERRADSSSSEVERLRHEIASLQQQLNESNAIIERLGPHAGMEDGELLSLELDRIREELETTKRAFRDQDAVLARAEEETLALVQTSRLKEHKMKEERMVLENRVMSLEGEVGRFEADMRGAVGLWKARAEEFKSELLRVQSKVATMAIELEAAKARADASGSELERVMLESNSKEAKLDKMRVLMQRMEAEVQSMQFRHRRELDDKENDLETTLSEHTLLRSQVEALELDLQIARDHITQLEANSGGEKHRLAAKEDAMLKLEQEVLRSVEEASETVAKLNAELDAAKKEALGLRPYRSECESLRADLVRACEESAKLHADIVHLSAAESEVQRELAETRQRLVAKAQLLEQALDEGEEAHEGLRKVKDLNRLLKEERQKNNELERLMSTLRAELVAEKQFVAQMQGEIDGLRARADSARQELDRELASPHKDSIVQQRLRAQITSLENEVQTLHDRYQRQKQQYELELSTAKAALADNDSANQMRDEVARLRARCKQLEDQVAAAEQAHSSAADDKLRASAEEIKALEERCTALVKRAVMSEGEARRADVRAVSAEEELAALRREHDETKAALNSRIDKLVKKLVQLEGDLQAAHIKAQKSAGRSLDKSLDRSFDYNNHSNNNHGSSSSTQVGTSALGSS